MERRNANPLSHLLAVNLAAGSALGASFALLFLFLNIADLRTLVVASDDAALAVVLLLVGFASTFATAAVAGAVMMLSVDESGSGRGTRAPVALRAPAKFRTRVDRR